LLNFTGDGLVFIVLLVLTILGGVALIAGFAWLLASSGQTRRRSGPEVGAEVFGALSDGDLEDEKVTIPLAERTVFRGTGIKVERETELSYAEIKAALRERRWRQALPALLVIGGMSALLAFGSLTLLVRWDDRFVGVLIVALVFYTLIRIWIGFIRA